MLWAQLILLMFFLVMLVVNAILIDTRGKDGKPYGWFGVGATVAITVLSYFAGSFSEVVAWLN